MYENGFIDSNVDRAVMPSEVSRCSNIHDMLDKILDRAVSLRANASYVQGTMFGIANQNEPNHDIKCMMDQLMAIALELDEANAILSEVRARL